MRFAELTDIWGATQGLSGADKGRVYGLRGEALVADEKALRCFVDEQGVVNKEYLAIRIGCSKAALRQNTVLRKLVARLQGIGASAASCAEGPAPQNVVKFPNPFTGAKKRPRYTRGRIIVVEVAFEDGGTKYQIPTLVWPGRVDSEVSGWMRTLALKGRPLSTLLEYAKILRGFVRFRRERNILWDEVTDDHIRQYRDLKQRQGAQLRRRNIIVNIIFQFYQWAEETLRLDYHVQLYDRVAYDRELRHHRFAITSRPTRKRTGEITRTSSLVQPDQANKYKRRHTPTATEIENLHDTQLDSVHGERNSLLFAWAEYTGGRRFEILQIALRQLPTREQLDRIIDDGLEWSIKVIRKGGNSGSLKPTVDLLRRTLNFVDNQRAKIVARCAAAGKVVSGSLFITESGKPLSLSTLSDLSRVAFRAAGIRRASFHRLRAVFAFKEVSASLDALVEDGIELGPESLWKETILIRVSSLLDHSSLKSLKHYINDVISARLIKSTALKKLELDRAFAEKGRNVAALERELRKFETVHEFMKTMKLRKPTREGFAVLDKIRSEIETYIGANQFWESDHAEGVSGKELETAP